MQRTLPVLKEGVDFSSNDYLGFSNNPAFAKAISKNAHQILQRHGLYSNGATGSRLITGNHKLYELAETRIAQFHGGPSALLFNSGYDANVGFFQSVPQRGDIILYDEYIHASIRDGIQMSFGKGFKFKHNSLADLEETVCRLRDNYHITDRPNDIEIYVVTESVFSMDGDSPDLVKMANLCKKFNLKFVVDEAHAVGVLGDQGEGLVQDLNIVDKVFARIVTFGKGMGAHGAAIIGSADLKTYLINFARSFIYTTGLPPHSVAIIIAAYEYLSDQHAKDVSVVTQLQSVILNFKRELDSYDIAHHFIECHAAIHCIVIAGVEKVQNIAKELAALGLSIKPILSPTVAKGQERLRICLHAYNTEEEIHSLVTYLNKKLRNDTI
ncbi:aminotransferase class I/II-fold pyridoxal phosphate-dependent enzyme [Dokdonia sp. Hel_I_53]|uniref:aminotransferase class I/II-fold pyridoxal phosphate-dependent enzyme n=1 Tax=Dokdonia sp. Hel_I_53 TaxID=1566287 RepID=UPI0021BD7416|nr:pyridoxal phosphate-dependent aminotransferase family protein [Dokdonia sp. Hel_I_53]